MTFLAGTFAEVERREIAERTQRGKKKSAQLGRIPTGFGRSGGPYGLRYDTTTKRLHWVSDTHKGVVRRIVNSCLEGKSISSITVSLNDEGVPASSGGFWRRSSVHAVLKHASTYAGKWVWDGIEIDGVVEEAIITIEEVQRIQDRLQRNKELAKGFGRRHWLTGRVFGECGQRYSMEERKGAHCGGADYRLPVHCGDRNWSVQRLERVVITAFENVLSDPTAIRDWLDKAKEKWTDLRPRLDKQREGLNRRLDSLEKSRRLLSFQHEEGIITDDEMRKRGQRLISERKQIEQSQKDIDSVAETQLPPGGIEVTLPRS